MKLREETDINVGIERRPKMQRNVINAFGSMLATLSLFSGLITVMGAA
jgi:hypothetical protein